MEKQERAKTSPKTNRVHPKKRASIISHWLFCWELPIFYKGYKKQLTEDDLYGPLKAHKSKMLGDKLEKAWKSKTNPSLWRVLGEVFGCEFLMYGLLLIPIELGTRITQPVLIGRLLSYYTSNQTKISKAEAYIYAGCIVATSLIYVILGHSYHLGLQHLGMKIRIACSSLIYRKSLKLSRRSLVEATVGQVVNLMSNDVSRFDYVVRYAHFLWMGPLETLIVFGLLYWMLGPTAIIGLVFFLAFIPAQVYLSKKIAKYRMRTALKTDHRVRLMNEIILGMKVIKMYTWEKPFGKLVDEARKLEMRQIKSSSYFKAFNVSCTIFLSRTAIFSCVLVYVLTGGILDPEYVYVLASFYEVIRLGSVIFLPFGMMLFGETLTSVRRIEEFLIMDETETLTKSDCEGIKLSTLVVPRCGLVAITGPVGSGKSTILETILGEVINNGTVQIGGTISYAAQQPWLFGGTIRENIIFGDDFDKDRYSEVVRACALEHDFEVLPFGDQSLVGDRGVLLSGGQKARINLARAVYKNADFYLLDDPLSAVDAHVGKQIFDNCINGYLQSKARVLVTHQLQYLRSSNLIYLVEDGKVKRLGLSDQVILKFLEQKHAEEVAEKPSSTLTVKEEKPVETKESQEDGVVSTRIYYDYCKAGGTTVVMILLHAIVQVIGNGTDYFLSFWVNSEQNQNPDSDYYLYIYSALIVTLIFVTLFCFFRFYLFCISASTNLHNQMFFKVAHSPMRFFHVNPPGRILNRFSKDIGLIDENLPPALADTIQIFFNMVAVSAILSIINPWILIPTFIMFMLFYIFRIVYLASSRNLKRIEARTRSPLYNHVTTSLEGLVTVRAFNAQNNLKNEYDKYQDLHSSSYYLFLACDGAFGFWLDFTCVIYLAIVTLSFLIIDSENYGANVGLSITQSIMMTGFLQWGMKQSSELENQMTSVERVVEYTKLKPETDVGLEVVPKLWPVETRIKFQTISLRYSTEDPYVLKQLSFEVRPKEKIGIVGRTGAGKSSLVSLIFRLAPFDGDLIIDGINTKAVPLEILRSRISIIPQEPVLFTGTVRYNLDPFEEFQDSELWVALEEVELKSMVLDLSSGLSSKVTEGGLNFSVGQRQLLCLARAVVRMNKILVLDEATANVDPKTDELIQQTIRRKFWDCTVLTIAHRLNTVMDSDRVLVMDDGCVVEFDRPEKLLEDKDGVFYRLVQHTGKEVS